MRFLSLSLLVLLLTGCATVPHFVVGIDSITDPSISIAPEPRFLLLSGQADVASNDLQFREYAGYVQRALESKGYRACNNLEEADLILFLRYGIGEPSTSSYTTDLPIFGQTGGGISTFNATTYGSRGTGTTTGTVSQTPSYGVVGSIPMTNTITLYRRHMILEALQAEAFRATKATVPVWKTTAVSVGGSGDLRRVFPYMVGAGVDYFGKDTGKLLTLA